ncbi:MAG: PAS domain S-box protein [Nitriliruptorales bacterium]|nr:PAS domain S-box protein [Nitriliruptorales bacterium]
MEADGALGRAAERSAELPAAAVVVDRSGTVVGWNDAARELYGWGEQEAVGRSAAELGVPVGAAGQANAIVEQAAAGKPWSGAFLARRKDGTAVEVWALDAPVRHDGTVAGLLGVSVPTGPSDWRLLIEHAADALSVHELDGTFRYASPAWGELFGYDPPELVGRDIYDLFHPDDLDDAQTAHAAAVVGSFSLRQRIRQADGTYRWVEVTGRGIRDEDVLVVVARPVDQQRSLEQSLEQQRAVNAQLTALRQQRTQFLTTVAHRARHPMTVVNGVAELLSNVMGSGQDDALLDLTRRLLPRLKANAAELTELVEDVTNSDLLTRGAAQLRNRPVDLHDLAEQVVDEFADSDAPVSVEIDPWHTVMVDATQIRLALKALVHNAIVHTPLGTSIWISAEDAGQETVVTVEDAGPGVPDEDKQVIFEPFSRTDDDDPDPGMGLGLHMVAQIAALHGGHAWVDDSPHGGAAFKLRLPQRRTQDQTSDPDAPPTP